MKKFLRTHLFFENSEDEFTEEDPPRWLYGDGKGSTMDNRWFWDDYVMKLEVGKSIDTDFNKITRIE